MQNKFTQPKKVLTADANTFTAVINVRGDRNFHAAITAKAGYKVSVPGITAATEEALMTALQKLDGTVRFYKKNATNEATETRASKDAEIVEALRVDPKVSDKSYYHAAKTMKIPILARPDFTNTQARAAVTPTRQLATDYVNFENRHPELLAGGFIEQNVAVIQRWLADENKEGTAVNLEVALAELKEAGMIRNASTGRLGGAIVVAYSHGRILQMRKSRATQQFQMPEGLSPADEMAWSYVHSEHPNVPTNSLGFKKLCSQQLLDWAKQRAVEADPSLKDKPAELRKSMDSILLGWARQSQPNAGSGNRSAVATKVWLG